MKLNNKVVVITGASDGIGKCLALKFAKEKTQLVLLARNKERLEKIKKEALNFGAISVNVHYCDLRNLAEIQETVGKIGLNTDILINCAGIWQKRMCVEDLECPIINDVLAVNLRAPIEMIRLLLPALKRKKESIIVNVVSKSGVIPSELTSIYTASKGGLSMFTESLRKELVDTSVRIMGVYQGGTATGMFDKSGEKIDPKKYNNYIDPENLADEIVEIISSSEIRDIKTF